MSTQDDQISISSSDGSSEVQSRASDSDSPTPAPPVFPFNEELDTLWERCHSFSTSFAAVYPIHPLHLALALLYDGLHDCHDPRLHEVSTHIPTVERPLFWVALSKFAKPALQESLDVHIKFTSIGDVSLPLPVELGVELCNKLKELALEDYDLPPEDVEIHGLQGSYCDATGKVLTRAKEFSIGNDDLFMAPHHILFALLEDDHVSAALSSLRTPIPKDDLAQVIRGLRKTKVQKYEALLRFPLLNEFAIDETREIQEKPAAQDPIIGRNHELRRIIAILSRKSKNSAVLLGDPGVGKTAIARSLAWRIVKGKVHESVVARVFCLDLGSLLASTACKSAYEQIIQMILDEIAEHEDRGIKAIIFIDELSQITIGGYRGDGTGIDAATLMKPFIRSGRLRCVGCSTWEDYRSLIGKDGALARLFSTVSVCEPSVPETVAILRSLKDGLEGFHTVRISDDAFVAAASIAARFFAHKRLPDSAIELVDEACSNAKTAADSSWDRLGKWKRLKVAMEMHLQSLQREYDDTSERLAEQLQTQLLGIDAKIERHRFARDTEKPIREKIEELEARISKHNKDIPELGKGQYNERKKAAQDLWDLRKEREEAIGDLERKRAEIMSRQSREDQHDDDDDGRGRHALSSAALQPSERPTVSKLSIVQAASWYRAIHHVASGNERKQTGYKPLDFNETLSKTVVEQPEAVNAVSEAAQCLSSGLSDPSRPVASFLFGGPPGSGKVLLAKQVAELLLGSSDKLVQIHGADYAQSHSLSRLIGTPVCTGFDKGGQLTECVRRRPISVVLIHEIEKACVEFRQFIQTILDEGSVKDGEGRLVDFTNSIVIMTTNLGQEAVFATQPETEEREHFLTRIRQTFPVEFLARVDDLIVFRRITEDLMPTIVEKRLSEVAAQLQRIKLGLDVREEARTHLVRAGWSSTAGARALEGVIRSQVLLPISTAILHDRLRDKWTMRLSYDEVRDMLVAEPVEPMHQEIELEEPTPSIPSITFSDSDSESSIEPLSDQSTQEKESHERRDYYYGVFASSSPDIPTASLPHPSVPVSQPKAHRLF